MRIWLFIIGNKPLIKVSHLSPRSFSHGMGPSPMSCGSCMRMHRCFLSLNHGPDLRGSLDLNIFKKLQNKEMYMDCFIVDCVIERELESSTFLPLSDQRPCLEKPLTRQVPCQPDSLSQLQSNGAVLLTPILFLVTNPPIQLMETDNGPPKHFLWLVFSPSCDSVWSF